ncbi:MAG: GMC oxidoreductase [Acidobacteriaceae bacterium]
MEIDLATTQAPGEVVRAQVCVVGAGIAGLVLARKLALGGIDVVVLEAGGRRLETSGQEMFGSAELKGQRNVGTVEGRFRVFGGSSLRWGGQVLSAGGGVAWLVRSEDLAPYVAEAEDLLEVGKLPFEAAGFFAAIGEGVPQLLTDMQEVEARVSKWMAFPRRNLADSLGKELLACARVYLHAQAVELQLGAGRCGAGDGSGQGSNHDRIGAVLVKTPAGSLVRFEAQEVVVAAGTVETARLLLASRSVAKEGVGNAEGQVGKNFHDHLTLPVATFTGEARARVASELRPWVFFAGAGDVRGGTLHSVKLEASAALRERLDLNPILAHLAIAEPEGSGIAVVREMLTSVQRGEADRALATHAVKIPGAMLEGVRMMLEAKLKNRRFLSKRAELRLQFNVAQDAPSSSHISLGSNVDWSGVPQAVVDWRVTGHEMDSIRRYAEHLERQFQRVGLTGVQWAEGVLDGDEPMEGLEDARHAMGGACMGTDPRSSVVDGEMRVHGVENLSIASAATFPDGSAQLPTLTMMALALRLSERIRARVVG